MFQDVLVKRWNNGFKMKESEKKHKQPEQEKEKIQAASGPTGLRPGEDSEIVEISRPELEELKQKSSEFSQLQERLLRSAADFENARKRLAKEREEFIKYALEDVIYQLLPVLDNFNFALSHISGDDDKTRSMREGFLLIQKQLLQIMSERGLKPIEISAGKPFDPHKHEAVGSIVDPNKPEGVILEEVQTGYELNGKLLRPAKVKISTHHKPQAEEKAEELT